jgi:sirohydrochlorin cobaltochelatase
VNPAAQTIPIILTAFGTTARAFSTYEKLDAAFREAFPTNPIHWAYTSRMVKHAMKKKKRLDLKDPLEMAGILADQGHPWAVIQSLHLICGHEFDRLVAERDQSCIRSSMGLPLLTSHRDYMDTAMALAPLFPEDPDQAVVLVGHGTDHPAWSVYPALEAVLRGEYGNRVFVGVVEDYPGLDHTLDRIRSAGFQKVCLIPLMLVAGVHFKEDLTCEKDSWQKTFERSGIQVSVKEQGIGEIQGIAKIFCRHIAQALDVIPV